jgi:ribonuclease P protein component
LRIVTIKDRIQLSKLYGLRTGFKTEHFFFRYCANQLKFSRFCFSTKGALANAVLRNKIKRWQKAVLQTMPELAIGHDILITTLQAPDSLDFLKVQSEMNLFFKQSNLIYV